MTRLEDTAPPQTPDENVCDENAINDAKSLAVKSAVQGPVIVDKVTLAKDAGHEDDEDIPESQPAEFAVPAVQPMKREYLTSSLTLQLCLMSYHFRALHRPEDGV